MGLVTCPDCGKRVSDRAIACPSCGCPISESRDELLQAESNRVLEEKLKNKELAAQREKKEKEAAEEAKAKKARQEEEASAYEKKIERLKKQRYKGDIIDPGFTKIVRTARVSACAFTLFYILGSIDIYNNSVDLSPIAGIGLILAPLIPLSQLFLLNRNFMWKRKNVLIYLLVSFIVASWAFRMSAVLSICGLLGFYAIALSVSVIYAMNRTIDGVKIWNLMDTKGISEEVQKEAKLQRVHSFSERSSYSVDSAFSFQCESCGEKILHSSTLKPGDEVICRHCGSYENIPDQSNADSVQEFQKYINIRLKPK